MPEALTPEQLSLLRSLPWRGGWEITAPQRDLNRLVEVYLATTGSKDSGGKCDYERTVHGDTLLATLDAELDRQRREIVERIDWILGLTKTGDVIGAPQALRELRDELSAPDTERNRHA